MLLIFMAEKIYYRFNEAKGTYEYIEDESEGEME